MKPVKLIVPLSLIAALALIAYPLYAHCGKCAADGKTIASQLDQNKMTLAKFVTNAEQHSKGRAISVISELDQSDRVMVEVYCIVGDPAKIQLCQVDGSTGSVLGMKEVKEFPVTEASHSHDPRKPTTPGAPGTPGRPGAGGAGGAGGGVGGGAGGAGGAGGSAKMISNQTVSAACGACIYKMAGVTGCPLAVKIDGKTYLVEGATWPNHDYCDRECQATVTGKIEGDKFICTKLAEKKDQPS